MHLLITGGAGFIGSHLADTLLAHGHVVTVLDDLSTGRKENIAQCMRDPRFTFVEGTILDERLVGALVARADIVYHLAAALHVKRIVEHPLEALNVNIHGTEIVLQAAAHRRTKTFIASTSEVYGKNTKRGLTEEDDRILGSPLKSRWGYAAAKGIDELVAYSFWKEYGVPVVIARLFNTVGPRQTGRYGMVVPSFVRQALRGETVTVYGNGEQLRCFLHVHDCIAAIVKLMEEERAVGAVYNVGGDEEISMNDLAKKIIAMTKSTSTMVHIPYEHAYGDGFEDMERRFPSTQRLRQLTGWKPTMQLDAILQSVIDAYQRS